ncbi:tetratricopeptide repeat domain 19 [Phyllostomus discolor]|nr:tetratricopeptide repeat domain 19 [Phyllostomus discolor]
MAEDVLSVDEKANTHLLLGMCLDAYARYLLLSKYPSQAQKMYEKALHISEEILGETHPQTIVLMSDLATSLDAQGHLDEACFYVQRASDLARQTEHPELHMVLSNLAAILMHTDQSYLSHGKKGIMCSLLLDNNRRIKPEVMLTFRQRERKEERERNIIVRERHQSVASPMCTHQGLNCKSRHVP